MYATLFMQTAEAQGDFFASPWNGWPPHAGFRIPTKGQLSSGLFKEK